MKSKTLKKIEALNKRAPSTISQWKRYQQEYLALAKLIQAPEICPEFTLGHLMPVGGRGLHSVESKRQYLFRVFAARIPYIIDRNHESVYKYGKGWRTLTSALHEIHIESVAVFGGRKLEWLKAPSDVVSKFILPDGWHWDKDNMGIVAIDSDGVDYHPYWTDGITIDDIINNHAQNKQKRLQQLEYARFEELLKLQLNSTYVTLDDSIRAGNCVEGSLSFAERRLNIPRDQILGNSWFMKVPAIRIFNGEPRAAAACLQAFMRETTISI
jgi:hypothetical protein